MLSVRGLSILPRSWLDHRFLLCSLQQLLLSCHARSSNTEIKTTAGGTREHTEMTEEIIDREQLLAAFNELGVEEVDEAVSPMS